MVRVWILKGRVLGVSIGLWAMASLVEASEASNTEGNQSNTQLQSEHVNSSDDSEQEDLSYSGSVGGLSQGSGQVGYLPPMVTRNPLISLLVASFGLDNALAERASLEGNPHGLSERLNDLREYFGLGNPLFAELLQFILKEWFVNGRKLALNAVLVHYYERATSLTTKLEVLNDIDSLAEAIPRMRTLSPQQQLFMSLLGDEINHTNMLLAHRFLEEGSNLNVQNDIAREVQAMRNDPSFIRRFFGEEEEQGEAVSDEQIEDIITGTLYIFVSFPDIISRTLAGGTTLGENIAGIHRRGDFTASTRRLIDWQVRPRAPSEQSVHGDPRGLQVRQLTQELFDFAHLPGQQISSELSEFLEQLRLRLASSQPWLEEEVEGEESEEEGL